MTTAVVPPPGQGTSTSAFATTENVVATSENLATGSTAYTDLATVGPAVTITVPASGKVIVTVTCQIFNNTQNGMGAGMSFALSGANTVAATDTMKNYINGSNNATNAGTMQVSSSFLLTGLTAGSTTFTAKYNYNGGGSHPNFLNRKLCVEPVDADVASGGTAAFSTTENVVATRESTSSGSMTDLTTVGPSVTITVPASGKAKVTTYAQMDANGTSSPSNFQVAFAMSGANTLAAGSNVAYILYRQANNTNGLGLSQSTLLTGLTPGSTTFKLQYQSDGSNTAFFQNRRLRVEPVDGDKG